MPALQANVLQEQNLLINNAGLIAQPSLPYNKPCTIGSTLVAAFGWDGSVEPTNPTVQDSAGQTWSIALDHLGSPVSVYDPTNQQALALYYFEDNQSILQLVVTATWPTNPTFTSVQTAELGNVMASSFQVGVGAELQTPGTGTDQITTGTATPTAQPAIVWGFMLEDLYNVSTTAAGTGFVPGITMLDGDGGTPVGLTESKRITSLTPLAATWTDSLGGVAPYTCVMGIFTEIVAPNITVQPVQQTAASGSAATFGVTATASGGSLTYQWYKNSSSISGATSSSYTTPTLSSSDNGNLYYCAVTDSNGTVNTSPVYLFIQGLRSAQGANQNIGFVRSFRGRELRTSPDMLFRKQQWDGLT